MPALDARRVKLTIFFPIDEPLSIDDALSGSSSKGGLVISSSAAASAAACRAAWRSKTPST